MKTQGDQTQSAVKCDVWFAFRRKADLITSHFCLLCHLALAQLKFGELGELTVALQSTTDLLLPISRRLLGGNIHFHLEGGFEQNMVIVLLYPSPANLNICQGPLRR